MQVTRAPKLRHKRSVIWFWLISISVHRHNSISISPTDRIMPRLIRIPLPALAGERWRERRTAPGTWRGAHIRRGVSLLMKQSGGEGGGKEGKEGERGWRRGDDEIARPFEFSIGRGEIMRLTPCKIGPLWATCRSVGDATQLPRERPYARNNVARCAAVYLHVPSRHRSKCGDF